MRSGFCEDAALPKHDRNAFIFTFKSAQLSYHLLELCLVPVGRCVVDLVPALGHVNVTELRFPAHLSLAGLWWDSRAQRLLMAKLSHNHFCEHLFRFIWHRLQSRSCLAVNYRREGAVLVDLTEELTAKEHVG